MTILKDRWRQCTYCAQAIEVGEEVLKLPINKWQMSYAHPRCHLEDIKAQKQKFIDNGLSDMISVFGFDDIIARLEKKIQTNKGAENGL